MKMKATKPLTYGTRRLRPGDEFDAKPRHARLLEAIGKAGTVRDAVRLAPPPAALVGKVAEDGLAALRAEYREAVGKPPFNGWDAATLRVKIAAAKSV